AEAPFFTMRTGTRLNKYTIEECFLRVRQEAGVRRAGSCPAAVPLQHRGARRRGSPCPGDGPRPGSDTGARSLIGPDPRQAEQTPPCPFVGQASPRASSLGEGSAPAGTRLPHPPTPTADAVWDSRPGRALRPGRGSDDAVGGKETCQPAHDPAHD